MLEIQVEMTMAKPLRSFHYRSYMLRFWEERPTSNPSGVPPPIGQWRFSLEDPHSGTRLGFANFDQLIGFLENQMQSNFEEGTPT